MDDIPVFRASKRRKTTAAPKVEQVNSNSTLPAPEVSGNEDENESEEVSSLVKPRHRSQKARSRGVQFSNARVVARGDDGEISTALVRTDGNANINDASMAQEVGGLQSRFVGSGGGGGSGTQVGDGDRYMTDYIDRAMAERTRTRAQASTTNATATTAMARNGEEGEYTDASSSDDNAVPEHDVNVKNHVSTDQSHRNHTHHLAEVDLTPNPTSNNILQSGAERGTAKPPRRKKPRLGRDGKPFRPRPRRGPNAEDVARDRVVEEVLHEHGFGLGTYDSPSATASGTSEKANMGGSMGMRGNDEAADERMAVEFQRQFLEGVQERQGQGQSQKQGQAKSAGASGSGAATAASSGPRLGGSRSARARMAEMQAQAQTGGKGKEK